MTSTAQNLTALLLLASFFLSSCGEQKADADHWTPDLEQHVTGYTSGVISAEDEIVVQLSEDIGLNVVAGTQASEDLFEFDPAVEGKAVWKSENTLAFLPDARFSAGTQYKVRFSLGKLIDVKPELRVFSFDFMTLTQHFDLNGYKLEGHSGRSLDWNQLEGTITSNDVSSIDEIAERLSIQGLDQNRLQWSCPGDRHIWKFKVDSIQRTSNPRTLIMASDGEPFSELVIPALDDFSLLSAQVSQLPDQKVTLTFSSPILERQTLIGFFQIDGEDIEDVLVDGSTVVCRPSEPLNGEVAFRIAEGLKNTLGERFLEPVTKTLTFTVNKPAVEFLGEGTIVPTSGSAQIPFRAVGLTAVDVLIHQVLEQNTHQFFQDNTIDGHSRLRRVARPVVQRRIELGSGASRRWENYSIDLGELIERAPGAIYRVEIGFRPSYTDYPCAEGPPEDGDGWEYDPDVFSAYRSSHYLGYNYGERENPCHVSYYGSKRTIEKNVLVSDVGLVVKGSEQAWKAYVTHLTQGAGLPGAEVTLMNYQGQTVAAGTSDEQGAVDLLVDGGKPFMAVASWNGQKAYVKLENAQSLSVSAFDVKGVKVAEGVQCMLYAERGVWRPGDTVYLDAILDDTDNPLPPDYPMVFTVKNPKGVEAIRRVVKRGKQTILPFHFNTEESDPTGTWQAKLEIGAATFAKSIAIETIQPNRLDIALTSGKDIVDATRGEVTLDLSSEWLTGAKAGGLKYQLKGRLKKDTETLSKAHPGYHFFDDTRSLGTLSTTSIEGDLTPSGTATIQWPTGYLANNPGPLQLVVGSRVYEPGGRFSMGTHNFKIAPFEKLVGFKMPESNSYGYWETDRTHQIDVLCVGPDGAQKPGTVKVEVFKVDWSWWWRQGEDQVSSLSSTALELLKTERLYLPGGAGSFKLNIPDDQWGRIFIKVSDEDGKHVSSQVVLFDWSYGQRASRGNNGDVASEILSMTFDKDEYEVGDVAAVEVPSAKGGTLILSVENGSGLLTDRVVTTTAGSTKVEVPLTEGMAPHCYFHAMVIQSHGDSGNDRPIRMYGIEPVKVSDPSSLLEPTLTLSEEIEPNSTLSIEVEEANGVGMEYTLAVVDEGLLGLTRFQTPDPHAFFTRRAALGVRTWDMFAWVLEAFSGKIAQVLSVGGDGAVSPENLEDADRFRPVVAHLGPFQLEKGETGRHEVEIQNYLGKVRVMVIAADGGRATGRAESNVVVKQDLMVQMSLPRLVAPGERVDVPVTVFAMEEDLGKVDVKIAKSSGVDWSATRKSTRFDSSGQQTLYFSGTIQENATAMQVKVEAKGSRLRASDVVSIDVRNPMPRIRRQQSELVTESLEVMVEPFGIPESRICDITVSKVPDVGLKDRTGRLLTYPHGCSEQVTSKGLVQLHLDKWIELNAEQTVEQRSHVVEALNILMKRQLPGGGFVYWPGNTTPHAWVSTYIGKFLLDAEKAGYSLPNGMLERYIQFDRKQARNWSFDEDRPWEMHQQAHRLMVLAEAGQPEVGAMTRLRNFSGLDDLSAILLAGAYAELNETDLAQNLLARERMDLVGNRRHQWRSFGSQFRNQALYVSVMHKAGMQAEAVQAAFSLAEEMGRGWKSTQEVAVGLAVLTEVLGGEPESSLEIGVQLGEDAAVLSGNQRIIDWTKGALSGPEILRVNHDHPFPVHVNISQSAVQRFGEESAFSEGLKVNAIYMDSQGNPIDVNNLKAGTVFYSEVHVQRVDLGVQTERMALSFIVPSGWELSNVRLSEEEASSRIQYQDIRDDRVNSYFQLAPRGQMTLRFEVVATYPGRYYAPPTYGEAMYNGSVQGGTQGQWVTVQMP